MGALTRALGIQECQDCGKKGVLTRMYRCESTDHEDGEETICNDRICEDCLYQTILVDEDGNTSITTFCSRHFKNGLGSLEIEILDDLRENDEHIYEDGSKLKLRGKGIRTLINNAIRKKERNMTEKKEKDTDDKIKLASEHEESGRFDEAVRLYESLEMWKDAGRARRRAQIENTVDKLISIEEKDIFDRIRNSGDPISYKCTMCAGMMEIDGTNKILQCPYCDGELDIEKLTILFEGSREQ